ncbi:MAG: LemA family protein [Alphaproteobacteria bacterium]|nr:LemA family protein [Alphaproteobacteria bacterium]
MSGWAWLAIAALPVIVAIYLYNNLVGLRAAIRNSWSQIDVQLKRRLDLIPNLVETVKGSAKHEQETLLRVISARNAVLQHGPSHAPERLAAEAQLSQALAGFKMTIEAYPDLKASAQFSQLMQSVEDTENRIAMARQALADEIERYDTARQSFPAVLVAAPLGFGPETGWSMAETERGQAQQAPKIAF